MLTNPSQAPTASPQRWSRADLPALFLTLCLTSLYMLGASSTIQIADNADFLTAVGIAGIPHPSGYPLYTMLGILVHRLGGWEVPVALSYLSAWTTGLMLWGLYGVCRHITASRLCACLTLLLAGLSRHIWEHATFGEAFSLLGCMAIWLTYFALQAADSRHPRKERLRAWLSYALLTGLASSHHQTIILTAPLGLYLLWHLCKPPTQTTQRLKLIGLGGCLFLLGLTPYTYLYVQGANPKLGSWGKLDTPKALLDHVLRRTYGTFSSGGKRNAPFGAHTQRYLAYALTHTFPFGLALFWFVGLGLALLAFSWRFSLFARQKEWLDTLPWKLHLESGGLLALLSTWFLTGVFFPSLLHHSDNPIGVAITDRFFLLPDVFLLCLAAIGLSLASSWLQKHHSTRVQLVSTSIFCLWCIGAGFFQYTHLRTRQEGWSERYMRDVLKEIPPNALLIEQGDDVVCFGLQYLLYAKKLRPDIRFVCRGYLSQPWYIQQRKVRWPELTQDWRGRTISSFALIRHYLRHKRPVHVMSLYHPGLRTTFRTIPYGLTFQVLPKESPLPPAKTLEARLQTRYRTLTPQPPIDWRQHPWPAILIHRYASPWLVLSSLYRTKGNTRAARRCLKRANPWYQRFPGFVRRR